MDRSQDKNYDHSYSGSSDFNCVEAVLLWFLLVVIFVGDPDCASRGGHRQAVILILVGGASSGDGDEVLAWAVDETGRDAVLEDSSVLILTVDDLS